MPADIKLFLLNTWTVLAQMSPYLLLGFLLSGILSVFISPLWVEKHLGKGKFSSVLKATLFGIPLPLCSCGVIPVAASLKKHGASKSATTSFLLSTPQTGVDSILATWGLLGGFFAIFRPIAALITGILGGVLVSLFDKDSSDFDSDSRNDNNSQEEEDKTKTGFGQKISSALKYGLVTLPGEIARPLIIGIIIAGIISSFVASNFLNQYLTNYYLTMILMLVIGVPLYVCSTSSIPIALGFIHLGVSPGAALVFLISGPATNAAAISVVINVLGKKSAIIYLLTVIIGSLASGIAFDSLNQTFSINVMDQLKHGAHGLGWFGHLSALLMVVILLYSWYKARTSEEPGCGCSSDDSTCKTSLENSKGKVFTLEVKGMTCGNCVKAVKRTLEEIPGVIKADVSLKNQQASVTAEIANPSVLPESVNELGYKGRLL
ncbi:MAG: SO_0444 family Cu/Zn efflux transporter [Candidatus Rifleibacteriota bacterium]